MDGSGLHVLVVDDEPDLRLSVRVTFETEGYRVSHAVDGRDALDVLRAGARPDVILLDARMPRMDGWDCLEELKRDPELRRIPVVMFTTKAEDLDRDSGSAKPELALVHPVGPITLLNAVKDVLQARELSE